MANADRSPAPSVPGEYVICRQPSILRVVVHIPLDAKIVDGLKTETRDDGREVSRSGKECHTTQVQRRVEDIAPVGNHSSAEGLVDEILLGNLPTGPLARLCGALAGWLHFLGSASLLYSWAQVKALCDRVAHLVGIGCNVRGVDQQNILRLCADASDISIGHFRLDHMAQLTVPARQFKVTLKGRRAYVHRCFNIGAVERL